MRYKRITLIGGSGFVGRHLTYELARRGYQCRILTRRAHRQHALGISAALRETDIFDLDELSKALKDTDAVIHLVGILNTSPKQPGFRQVHVELTETVVKACHRVGVKRLLHMSALRADQATGSSQYLRTKGEAENRAHTLGPPNIAVTSFRPSVIFGPDDSFLNRFAALLALPVPFPLACPDARFAPVYIGDVVQAFVNSLEDKVTFGQRYALCGPDVYTLEEIVRFIAKVRKYRRWIIPLSESASKLQATVLQFAPGKPFTPDNYDSLKSASVCTENGLVELGIRPTSMQPIASRFLTEKTAKLLKLERLKTSRR